MEQQDASSEEILLAQQILSAASRHDTKALEVLLKHGSANVRDPATGTAPLHAAVEACGEAKTASEKSAEGESDAEKTVHLLLQNGAIWNDLNHADETPGCIALKLKQTKIYEMMVEAGVRAELLLSRMAAMGLSSTFQADDDEEEEEVDEEESEAQPTAAPEEETEEILDDVSKSNTAYLKSTLRYRPGILLDSSDNAVMMQWEDAIMKRHAETLLPTPGLTAINVGHGMGLVDTAIQARQPAHHHIIEAHPQVHQRLRETGWYEKPNVTIHEGRWQDVLPKLVEQGVLLDAVYYDTFAEDYDALKEFFSEWVVNLLKPEGRFGWYNGLGADRQVCYDVYTKVSEMDLYQTGFDTVWEDIPVPADLHGSSQWDGTRRPYWTIDVYRLPVNTFRKDI